MMRSFDLVALDSEDIPFLIVEAKHRAVDLRYEEEYLREVGEAREAIPYGMRIHDVMLADPRSMRLYHFDQEGTASLVASWPTVDTLSRYDPKLGETADKPYLDPNYLTGLISRWFRDLDAPEDSPGPPGLDRWRESGLLSRFAKGWSRFEVPLGFDLVR